MTKENTTKVVLIAGGAALVGYLMINQGLGEKIKNALAGLAPGGGLGFGDITFPAFNLPAFNLTLPEAIDPLKNCNLSDLFGSNTNKGTGGGSSQLPAGGADIVDVVYTMPSWAKGVIGVSAGIVGGYGGYQIARYSAPALRSLGNVAAKGLAGAGNFLGRIFGTTGTAIATRLAQLLGRGGQAGMIEVGALSTLGGIANVFSVFPTLLTLSGTDPIAQRQWASEAAIAQGGSPPSVAPSSSLAAGPSIIPNLIIPPVATRTTPLANMPSISPNAITSIGWRQVRQTPSITVQGKTYGFFTAPGTKVPDFTPVS